MPEPTFVVHRHPIHLQPGTFTLPIHDDATIINVGRKDGDPHSAANVWECHRTDLVRPATTPARTFRLVGTGAPFTGALVGSWEHQGFVWHLIEETADD